MISVVLILLTGFQACTNNDLVAVGILESAHSHGEVKDAVEKIENICEPLIEEKNISQFKLEISKVKQMVQRVEDKLNVLQSKYKNEINDLKKEEL